MARYVGAVDSRDGDALTSLYTTDGRERLVYHNSGGTPQEIATFAGRAEIQTSLNTLLPEHKPGAWAHHTTFDHIVTLSGDRVTLHAQFVVWTIAGPRWSARTRVHRLLRLAAGPRRRRVAHH
ncbi:nuclear transport factor 2 family protein [Streptomyces sp. HC307]|uniref:nuclear transport factor 2 family protein n=1 Tax=Streptomyces flavusporus TaxID=3385496 RepID=UPI003916F9CF